MIQYNCIFDNCNIIGSLKQYLCTRR